MQRNRLTPHPSTFRAVRPAALKHLIARCAGVICVLCSLLLAGSLHAADVSLTTSDPINLDSWDEAGRWNNAAAPSAGNNYFTAGFRLRTPNNMTANTTFPGGSLTVNRGDVMYKGSGSRTITINNLTLDGGTIVDGNGNTTVTLSGNWVTVNTTGCFDSTTDSSDRHIVITSPILGTGIITNRGNGSVQLTSTASTFSGKWILQGNQTRVQADAAFGAVPGAYVADSITLDGGVLLNRDTEVAIAANRGITLTSRGGRLEAGWSKYLAINSVITGSGGLTIMNDATPGIILLNAANSYTGPTVVQNNGWLQVNGSLAAASAVTVQGGGLLLGNGVINGLVTADANANIGPGGLFAPGTLTINNAANLNGCALHVDLANSPAGSDLLVVNGNLSLSGTITVSVLPLSGTLTPGTYRLINYTGTLTGSAANFVAAPSGFTVTFDTSTPGQVNMNVQSGAPASLVWKGDDLMNVWDFTTPSWLSGASAASFRNGDSVLLDDSGANILPITVATSALVNSLAPGAVTVDAAKDYTIGGGRLAGPMTLTKRGTGMLTLAAANVNLPNYFSGGVLVEGGVLKVTYPRALGDISGGTTVRGGGTLDVNGQDLGFEPFTVEGAGVGGAGALVNSGGGQNNALRTVTLTGHTTVGGTGRFDIRNVGGNASLSTGGNAYNLTKKGPNQFSLVGVATDPALGDIDVQEGIFGFETTSTMGDASKTMTFAANTQLRLWNLSNDFYKPLIFGGGVTTPNIENGSGTNTIVGPVTLAATSLWNVNAGALAVYSGIEGAGGLTKSGSTSLYLYGTNTYAGPTTILGDGVVLGANASISNTPAIVLANGTTLNVSAISAASGAFVLNSGQTLSGSGTVIGNVTAGSGASIVPGTSAGTLTFNGNVALDGATAVFELGATTTPGGGISDLAAINGNLSFSGTVTIRIHALAPLDTVNPYTIATYTGTLDLGSAIINVESDSRYTFTLDPVTTPGAIRVIATATGIGAEALTWQGNIAGSETLWDLKTTMNWSNTAGLADQFYLGDRVVFDDTAVGTAVELAGTVAPGSLVVSNETRDFTWTGAGKLSGSAGLVKQGAGKLTIANTGANENVGATTISVGTLEVGNGGTAGALNSAAVANSGNLVFNRSDNITVANAINGAGQVEKKGAGVLTLSTAQSGLTGPITVTAGTLRTGNAASLGTVAAGTTVASGATLDVNAQTLGNEAITVSGSGVGAAGAIYNSAGEQQNATRYVILAGDTTFGGTGRWDIRANGTPSGLAGNNYTLTKVGPNQVWLVGLGEIGVGDVVINQGTFGFETTSTMGNPSATLTVNPGATIGLYGNNNAATPLNKVAFMNTATWANNNGDNFFSGPVTLSGPNTFNTASGTTLRLLGAIGGSGSLAKVNSGTLILGGDNTYSGNTSVQAGGILRIGNAGSSGSVVGTIYNSGRVDFDRSDLYTPAFNIVGTGGIGIRSYVGVVWNAPDRVHVSGTVEVGRDAAGTLWIEGTANPTMGNLFLGNPASMAGEVWQNGGEVIVTNQVRIGHWATETSTYRLQSGNLTLVGTPAGPAAGNTEYDGIIYVGVDGTGIFTQSGGTATAHGLVLDNRGGTAGDDTLNLDGGTLVLGPSGMATAFATNSYVVNLGGGTIVASASWSSALNMNLTGSPTFDTGPNTIQLSGVLSSWGGLTKIGAGTLVLSGANTYSGATVVSAGTLSVAGALGAGGLQLTSATLSGNGTIASQVQIPAGSTLAPGRPGTPIGTLTCTYATAPAVSLAGTTELEISKAGATRANDKVVAVSGIEYGGILNIVASGDPLSDGDSFQLFQSGNYSGVFADIHLPTLRAGLEWENTLSTDGTIRVKATQPASLQVTVTGEGAQRALTISWDPIYGNHILQSQTNAVGQGLTTQWFQMSNPSNPLIIQPIPAGENVFFRLYRP